MHLPLALLFGPRASPAALALAALRLALYAFGRPPGLCCRLLELRAEQLLPGEAQHLSRLTRRLGELWAAMPASSEVVRKWRARTHDPALGGDLPQGPDSLAARGFYGAAPQPCPSPSGLCTIPQLAAEQTRTLRVLAAGASTSTGAGDVNAKEVGSPCGPPEHLRRPASPPACSAMAPLASARPAASAVGDPVAAQPAAEADGALGRPTSAAPGGGACPELPAAESAAAADIATGDRPRGALLPAPVSGAGRAGRSRVCEIECRGVIVGVPMPVPGLPEARRLPEPLPKRPRLGARSSEAACGASAPSAHIAGFSPPGPRRNDPGPDGPAQRPGILGRMAGCDPPHSAGAAEGSPVRRRRAGGDVRSPRRAASALCEAHGEGPLDPPEAKRRRGGLIRQCTTRSVFNSPMPELVFDHESEADSPGKEGATEAAVLAQRHVLAGG